ncbi:MAG: hypothetical protein HY744_11315 [Deltaproteobacteria bacterium]|nr:hypothetical protein [Deltaproteobacteria bacterium]
MIVPSRMWLLGASAVAVGAGCAGEPSLDSVQCNTAADCPKLAAGGCRRSACVSGACGLDVVPAGSPCSEGGGHVCGGDGRCVECTQEEKCAAGKVCDELAGKCVPAPCTNDVLDGEETAVDCGGPTCEPCATGETCAKADDCQGGWCETGVCQKLKAVAISAGARHTCAVLVDGTARCWGSNDMGQLGDASDEDSKVPVRVAGLSGVVAISAGAWHTCALLADGTARCWGLGQDGQLGNGTQKGSITPVPVSDLVGAVAITAGSMHACALLADGTARCWGWNGSGQLGYGGTKLKTAPVPVAGLSGTVAIAAGGSLSCALVADGTARCWGNNKFGQLGNGTVQEYSVLPVPVASLSSATTITAGLAHACALLANGTARCWGRNDAGQLGNGTTQDSGVPVAVAGLSGAVDITAGTGHGCALLADGTAHCWGWNEAAQLGDGSNQDSKVPVAVVGLAGAVSVAAGAEHTCAVLGSGAARCWGFGSLLGDGSDQGSSVPVDVAGW